jgi:endonuclease YncB( thermonuclease family)
MQLRLVFVFVVAVLVLVSAPGCSVSSLYAQAFLQRDSLKVTVLRVVDGDTYLVKYRKADPFKVRLRMPDPLDTVNTFDSSLRFARKQAVRVGLTVDSVQSLARRALDFVDSLITEAKGRVMLRKYPDQESLMKQISFDRLLRGVEVRGVHLGTLLRERHLTVESFEKVHTTNK